jgi:hypothetical protein
MIIKTYRASCHCGAIRFRFNSEEITRGLRCNCSICIRRGTVMSTTYFPPSAFEFESLETASALSIYQFGERTVNHYFCKTCGIHPFSDVVARPGHYRVNLGCVEGLDAISLETGRIDGRSF